MTLSSAEGIQVLSRSRLSPRVGYVALIALGIAGVAVLYTFDPRNPGTYPICPFLGLTGYHCPGCGTLRALHQLLHGNIIAALGYNPFTVLSLPFIAYSYANGAMRVFSYGHPTQSLRPTAIHLGALRGDRRVLAAPQRANRTAHRPRAVDRAFTPRTSPLRPRTPPACSDRGGRWGRRT